MMRVLCIADIHSDLACLAALLPVTETVDLVCIAGDLLDAWGNIPQQLLTWQRWIRGIQCPIALCEGNHDYMQEALAVNPDHLAALTSEELNAVQPFFLETRWPQALVLPKGSPPLFKSALVIRGGQSLIVSSLPYEAAHEVHYWEEGHQLRQQWHYPWMVLRHEPPALCALSEPTTGSSQARRWIQKYQPDYFLCGHIHTAPFTSHTCSVRIGNTVGINPGARERTVSYALLDTASQQVQWQVQTLP